MVLSKVFGDDRLLIFFAPTPDEEADREITCAAGLTTESEYLNVTVKT